MEMEINFDELASLQQANVRASQYEFKRSGKDKFTLSDKGKMVIGYDEAKGWEVKAGNGIVVIAVRLKEDPRVKFVRGIKGNTLTSNTLEEAIVKHLGEGVEKCIFEKIEEEYDGATWYKIVPVESVEDNENDDSSETENDSSNQESTNEEIAETQSTDESTENESVTNNDDF